jgi:DNA-binding MurR/RpiR family transcriptional regulator
MTDERSELRRAIMEKDFGAVIAERLHGFTKLDKRIAAYLSANPEAILVEPVASLR